jgi:hypothetical protein
VECGSASSITGSSITREEVGGSNNHGKAGGLELFFVMLHQILVMVEMEDGASSTSDGCTGGSGVVILRVPTASYSGTTTGSPTVTTDGSG